MWIVTHYPHPYNQTAGYAAEWAGPGPRPIGAFGEQIGVFNTTLDKARRCADGYNRANRKARA